MELKILRNPCPPDQDYTTGEFYVNEVPECYILEDKDRGLNHDMTPEEIAHIKVWGKTAIPAGGRHRVTKTWWVKHRRFTPMIWDVNGFSGVRMHSGVTANDTHGCPLFCEKVINSVAQNSKAARIRMDKLIFDALDRGEEVWITIERKEEIV